MRELPPPLRRYLWAIYLACLTVMIAQVQTFVTAPWHVVTAVAAQDLWGVAAFVVLAYAGERTTLQLSSEVSQSLATAVHIAAILLFPAPFPALLTLLAALGSPAVRAPRPLYKRAFNVCHPVLAVGLAGSLLSLFTEPSALLRPGHVIEAAPALTLLVVLYYALDVGTLIGVLALIEGRSPWKVWLQTHRGTVLPELAASTIGILAAATWRYDHMLLALLVLPVVALRVAFRAIAQAEERAAVLRHRGKQLETVLVAGQHLRLQQTQADLLLPMVEAARALVGAEVGAAYLRDRDDPTMLERIVIVPEGVAAQPVIAESPMQMPRSEANGGIRVVMEQSRVLLVPLESESTASRSPSDEVAGLLRLTGAAIEFSSDDRDALAILATQATIALDNARLHERALAQASEDGLTGLLNHRAFQTRLQEEVARARRAGRSLALFMIDLDDFGEVNNLYGHQIGDAALVAATEAVRDSLRVSDLPARYGGDEFAVILPETEMDDALVVAERTCQAIAACRLIESGATIRLGASIGVAALPLHATTRLELVYAADQAAYAAKHLGKGRVGRPEDTALTLDRDPAELASMLEHANMATVEALAAAVDAKDPYTRGHSQRVSAYAMTLASAMMLSTADIARVRLAGLLHDVGKIGVPDAILTKPGKLSQEEFAVIRQHPEIGERMLAAVPFLREILPAVRHHHERWDGGGYPDGLSGTDIHPDAAILAVVDALDAMTSSRTYRPALPFSEAVRRIREGRETQFDPRVVVAFEQALTSGALVLLSSEMHPLHERARAS